MLRTAVRKGLTPSRLGQARFFTPPVRDMKFVLYELLNANDHFAKLKGGELALEEGVVDGVIDEMAKFSKDVLFPLNVVGDTKGCKLVDGQVITPPGFKEAYETFVEGGWTGVSIPEEYGGQGFPASVNILKAELVATANWSWGMFPGLSQGCMNTLMLHGTEEQKQKYLVPCATGEWLGTMCLTEPQCGSDLAQVKTKAEPVGDGTYKITGTKIFISCGDHDFTDNICHIVLARLPNAPKGTKGISLFAVTKNHITEAGGEVKNNGCTTGSIEDKMGIHGSPTCVINFDDSIGELIGTPNRGLNHMFTFINTSRVGTALQGQSTAEKALQNALAYAKERRSMRALTGTEDPQFDNDRIIHHPDVRRMLLFCKALSEGGRAMVYHCSLLQDFLLNGKTAEDGKRATDKLDFLTPILKGFLTELGNEAASHGMQVFGGHGYIKGNKAEQHLRDSRIAAMYEGTTGIQALDLLGRKIMIHSKMGAINKFGKQVLKDCFRIARTTNDKKRVGKMALQISKWMIKWWAVTYSVAFKAGTKNKNWVGSASVDYLMMSGYITMGYYWLQMADVASKKLKKAETDADKEFYKTKLQTAEFYFAHMLPRAQSHLAIAKKGPDVVMKMKEDNFLSQC